MRHGKDSRPRTGYEVSFQGLEDATLARYPPGSSKREQVTGPLRYHRGRYRILPASFASEIKH